MCARRRAPLAHAPTSRHARVSGCIATSTCQPGLDPLAADAEPELCCICTDPLGEGDDHGALQLGCGHVFGARCIQEWLRVDKKTRRCPTCKDAVLSPRPLSPSAGTKSAARSVLEAVADAV